ncbi:MAG: PQQ-dependent sugar dehydrogenase, partial [Bacteroidota bacterium]
MNLDRQFLGLRSFFSNISLYLIFALILLLGFAAAPMITGPGLTSAEPFSAYLGGAFPNQLPSTWQWTNAYTSTGMGSVITARRIPGTNVMVLGTIAGKIYRFDFDQASPSAVLIGDIANGTPFTNSRFGLKGIAFHPEFGQLGSPNREYIYITYMSNNTHRRLSRFKLLASTGQLDLTTELIMIQQIVPGGSFHNVGEIDFGPDGFLYVPFGDAHGGGFGPYTGLGAKDTIMNDVQRIEHNLVGGIMRIDVDQDPLKSHSPRKKLPQAYPDELSGIGYGIPHDNPWLAADSSIMEEYYSLGHRNPWKLSFDAVSGYPWVCEVGPHNGEEINRIEKGHNYGWPYRVGPTGAITWDRTPPSAPEPNPFRGILTEPIFSPARNQASNIMLGCVYRGSVHPELYGKVITADISKKNAWAVDYDPLTELTTTEELPNIPSAAYTIFESPLGDLMLMRTNGTMMKLIKNPGQNASIPLTLSATGAFSNLSNMTPANGFIPYTVNTPLWSDRAEKQRWIALPNDGTFDSPAEQVVFDAADPWDFPEGTVIVKHFELALDESSPSNTTKVETRFIIIGSNGKAYGLTYQWRDDQSEADLLSSGATKAFNVLDPAGQTWQQTWTFPSRGECLTCHNENAGQILGLNTQQLNGDFTYPQTGNTDNQLNTWAHIDIFSQPIGDPAQYLRNVPLDDPKAVNSYKVRSYLDANCAYCHQPGGVNANFDGRINTLLASQDLLNGPTISAASHVPNVVLPGDSANSELWLRDHSVAADAMPPLAKSLVDEAYIEVLSDWINGLLPTQNDTLGEVGQVSVDDNWLTVNLNRTYQRPIIVAGAPSYAGVDPIIVRVRNVNQNSFEIRIEEWDCQDLTHAFETVPYLVVEAGIHLLPNGKKLMADTLSLDHNFIDHAFPQSFANTPVVLAQTMSTREASAVTIRQNENNASTSSFRLRLQEGEGSDGSHLAETVAYIAIEPGEFDGYLPYEIQQTNNLVEEVWDTLSFGQDYEHAGIFLGQIASYNGSDPCALRYQANQGEQVAVFLEEENCGDTEINHSLEEVAYFSFAEAGFLIGDIIATDLPVELLDFTASQNDLGVTLSWTTATEENNDYFGLERSIGGTDFVEIAQVKGAGNSQQIQIYQYQDVYLPTTSTYYRLRQVDFDGQFSYSPSVKVNALAEAKYRLYPNPTQDILSVQLSQLSLLPLSVEIFDLQGKRVQEETIAPGASQIRIDLSLLSKGLYLVNINDETSRETFEIL